MTRCQIGRGLSVAMLVTALGCRDLSSLEDVPPAGEGFVDIGFLNTSGIHVDVLQYLITGNRIPGIAGEISLRDPNATPSVVVGGIPPGHAYLLEVSATPDNIQGTCYGQSYFDVVAGQATSVDIMLKCATMVRTTTVNGMTEYCPSLASYAASPPRVPLGGTITLTASAFSYYSDPLMYGWRTTSGVLSSENTSVATYTCTEPGVHTLTTFVTDGYCPDFGTIDVTCVAPADAGVRD